MESAAAYAEPVTAPAGGETIPIKFTATGGEYFRIWIVNLLLTLLTLGIYSAWAKVRRQRYFYGSTSMAGSSFEYHGRPIQILKGRAIAVTALILYSVCTNAWPISVFVFIPLLAIAVPWVVVRSHRFKAQVTSWRNIRFRFHGVYWGAFKAYVGWVVAAILTLYLLLPRALFAQRKFLLSNVSFGTQQFAFEKPVGLFYKIYYLTVLMMLAAIIAVGVVSTGLIVAAARFGQGEAGSSVGGLAAVAVVLASVFVSLGLILALLAVGAYYEKNLNNASYDGLLIGPHRLRCQLRLKRLLYLYVTNVIGVLFTLGLFYPWALVRRLKYQLESMSLETVGSVDSFLAATDPATSATGEELGEFFDLDFGF